MDVSDAGDRCSAVTAAVASTVVVDESVLDGLLAAILARGNVLMEDVPGTGKTLTARTLATVLGLSFSRIQFTPDMLPADVTGTYVFDEGRSTFEFVEGPIFANLVLADEINRASPTTQSALLEAMEEAQVTVDGETHALPEPFIVVATQNPIERGDGTFPLPEAQKDRFMIKQGFGYPDETGELELLSRREARDTPRPEATHLLDAETVRALQTATERVRVHEDVKQYIVTIARASRADGRVEIGVSPRGTQRLFEASRAHAVLRGRSYVTPDDVRAMAHRVLAHRLVLTADATVSGIEKGSIVDDVLATVRAPTVERVPADPPGPSGVDGDEPPAHGREAGEPESTM